MNARRAEKYLAESFTAQVKRMREAAGADDAHAIAQLAEFEAAQLRARVAELVEKLFDRCEQAAGGGRGCGVDSPSRLCSSCSIAAGSALEVSDVAGGAVVGALVASGIAIRLCKGIIDGSHAFRSDESPLLEIAVALKALADLGVVPR